MFSALFFSLSDHWEMWKNEEKIERNGSFGYNEQATKRVRSDRAGTIREVEMDDIKCYWMSASKSFFYCIVPQLEFELKSTFLFKAWCDLGRLKWINMNCIRNNWSKKSKTIFYKEKSFNFHSFNFLFLHILKALQVIFILNCSWFLQVWFITIFFLN